MLTFFNRLQVELSFSLMRKTGTATSSQTARMQDTLQKKWGVGLPELSEEHRGIQGVLVKRVLATRLAQPETLGRPYVDALRGDGLQGWKQQQLVLESDVQGWLGLCSQELLWPPREVHCCQGWHI